MALTEIKWDQSGERRYENGVRHCVLYTGYSSTTHDYEKAVAWNGITSISESPEGAEPNDLYADDMKYATLRSTETFSGTIEAYMYPDEFGECDGSASPVKGMYLGQQSRKAFGLSYRTNVGTDTGDDDDGYKLHLVYGCTASPSERSYESINDSPDAITFSWEYTSTPVVVTTKDGDGDNAKVYKPVSTIVIDTTKLAEGDKSKLKLLEAILYGRTENGNTKNSACLPDPDEVIYIMSKGSLPSASNSGGSNS